MYYDIFANLQLHISIVLSCALIQSVHAIQQQIILAIRFLHLCKYITRIFNRHDGNL